ncbi:MAG TPA: ABC transporter permease, partial [Thermoanaerobaculia bacterium]|nr:ABC transporter permease [Thermoanaerobaculia bacterium]
MRKEHFRLVLREMRSHKFYSLINVLGLAVGMAASILILLWVQHELSFDRMHENAERIHRATIRLSPPGQAVSHTVLTPIPLAP